jgi:ribonuclease HI
MADRVVNCLSRPHQQGIGSMNRPTEGIAVDAAHSTKNLVTEFQGIDLATGEQIFYKNLGNQTVNIGEFLGVVEAVKYVIENDFQPRHIYTDSVTALTWFKNKATASNKKCKDLQKAEIFLKAFAYDVDSIEVSHWDNKEWGETPADFGNKGNSKK